MSYLRRVRHSLDPIMSTFINNRPLVRAINQFCERARRIEAAVGNGVSRFVIGVWKCFILKEDEGKYGNTSHF